MRLPKKYATIENEPVLLFDNSSSGSAKVELLTIAETAKFLKISVTGVRRLQYGRHVPFIKVGGSIRYMKSDLLAYVDKMRVVPLDQ